jgi:hypothetical protein
VTTCSTLLLTEYSTARNALASPLLLLPAELRNKIYAYVIQNGTYYLDYCKWMRVSSTVSPRRGWLGLLYTCRQVNAEAALLPYTLNIFHFTSIKCAQIVLERLSKNLRPSVTPLPLKLEVDIHLDWYDLWWSDAGTPEEHEGEVWDYLNNDIDDRIEIVSLGAAKEPRSWTAACSGY